MSPLGGLEAGEFALRGEGDGALEAVPPWGHRQGLGDARRLGEAVPWEQGARDRWGRSPERGPSGGRNVDGKPATAEVS